MATRFWVESVMRMIRVAERVASARIIRRVFSFISFTSHLPRTGADSMSKQQPISCVVRRMARRDFESDLERRARYRRAFNALIKAGKRRASKKETARG